MTRTILTLCAALALSGCSLRLNTTDADKYHVHYDEGCWTVVRQRQFAKFLANGTRVYIGEGAVCWSACTMYLGLPDGQVCVHPKARFGFHGAFPSTPENTWELAKYYPEHLQRWFYASGADKLVFVIKPLRGVDLHAMGIGDCGEGAFA